MSDQLMQLEPRTAARVGDEAFERQRLEHQARLLTWGGIGYHLLEAAIALGAGLAAGSSPARDSGRTPQSVALNSWSRSPSSCSPPTSPSSRCAR
jgi:hypothetical protein